VNPLLVAVLTGQQAQAMPATSGGGGACDPVPDRGSLSVAVLGPLIIGSDAHDLQPKQAELVTALALAGPAGLSGEILRGMLGADEDHPKPPDSLRQLITRTRGRLGAAPGGGQYIIHAGATRYVLDPSTTLDWHDFRRLAGQGRTDSDPRPIRDAFSLVRGQPFEGVHYWWLETTLIDAICAEIAAAAALLSALELAAGNPAAAVRAARAGLAVTPAAEQLWRALMRAEDAAANTAGVHQAWRSCLAAISAIASDGNPHPATAAVYRELTSFRQPVPADSRAASPPPLPGPCSARRLEMPA
jgi:DNA-binding SARP family transcriptional activator